MRFLTEFAGPPHLELADGWIFEKIREWERRSPDREAFIVDHDDRIEVHTYRDVVQQMERMASALAAAGIRRGDRNAILMENIPQWVFAFLGALRRGAVTVPLSTSLSASSIRLLLEHSGCRLMFTDSRNLDKAVAGNPPGVQLVTWQGEHSSAVDWNVFAAQGDPDQARDADEDGARTAILMYTSGTTGDPKGVELTLRNFNYEVHGMAEATELRSDHRILSVLPFSHVLPLVGNGLGPLCIGATVIFLHSISPQKIVESFHAHRVSFFICVPQFFYVLHRRIHSQVEAQPLPARIIFGWMKRLAGRISSTKGRRLLFSKLHRSIGPHLELLASGGSKFDPKVAEDMSLFGYTMLNAYGLTETTAAATATPPKAVRIGSVGKPIRSCRVRIGQPNSEGIGEVHIQGPILMRGYYNDPTHTAEAIPDGWLRTGDLGFLDTEGNLTITGRSKDVIVLANGKNVYPEEIEAVIQQSRLVREVCVVGLPDPSGGHDGENLHAIIVPDMDEFRKRGQTAILETIRFDIDNLTRPLPSYQRVHSVAVRNEPFPRTATRKLRRFEILAEERSRLAGQSESRQGPDHALFAEATGAVVARHLRSLKSGIGALDPALNLELDLGLDSLTRVELLGLVQADLGVRVEESAAARVFTLGELVEALQKASTTATAARRTNWKEIVRDIEPGEVLDAHILKPKLGMYVLMFGLFRISSVVGKLFFNLRVRGLEKLPRTTPYILCPNHESYLDAFVLLTVLPFRALRHIFVLGYSDYFETPFMRPVGRFLNVVSVDPAVNLVRAMQAGGAGLKHGKVLIIFPEGTRSIDGKVAEFKKGAAILSVELGVPMVPVGLNGPFEAWPRAGKLRRHPIEVVIGDPVDPAAHASAADPYASANSQLRDAVIAMTSVENDRR